MKRAPGNKPLRNKRAPQSKAVSTALARARAKKQKRGIALIMVLGAITILTVFLTELQTDTTSAVAGALAERDRLKAEYYAKSAVNLTRLLLASEKPLRVKAGAGILGIMLQTVLGTKRAPQIPIWEFTDMVLGPFNGGDRITNFGNSVGVDISTAKNVGIPGNGYFNLTITDEDSKININTAAGVATPKQLVGQLATLLVQPQYETIFQAPDGDGQQTDAAGLCAS
ncbi:MAG: type II secretion system protein GspK, partial [Polyangiaceae bacterium]